MSNKGKVITLGFFLAAIIIIITSVFIFIDRSEANNASSNMVKVDINEINYQIDNGDKEGAKENLALLADKTGTSETHAYRYIVMGGVSLAIVVIVLAYVYAAILRPFDRLESFASQVAAGNLDVPLNQEKGQYFGKFTWAFDSMRKEIKKARDAEKTAIDNNKTVIATLSHDIKTPISSIRTYCEALEANLDRTPEKRSLYLNTIMDKCDEVGRLTDDLFVHSVSDMNQLSVTPTKLDVKAYMMQTVELLSADDKVRYHDGFSESVYIKADPARLTQILENLVANSGKYAGTIVDIKTYVEGSKVITEVRDYGKGIPEENMPFITQKFYRGNNVEGIQGSGLGLYICNYLADKMGAQIELNNVYDGETCVGFMGKIIFDVVS
ncbi:MAG: HAMP domain-containing histidine kinase [Saccharofermentans sp.]|nr:HAMP domain-containing histidine kinase [Saccharofermentans sp.]